MDDKPALKGRFIGSHVERKKGAKNMDTEDFNFTTDDLVSEILAEYERELFDDELDVLQ